ncbi:hypothetical protein KI387_014004, partial [Taxus chinensis]
EQHFIFDFEELAEAMENFHDNKKLGEGGFGAVYKGTTRDGKEIAMKKLSARSTQGKKEFMNEVRLMANFQHRNLVKLLGCCAEGDERLFAWSVYEGDDVLSMVDSTIRETCPRERALRCIHLGPLCVQTDATLHPSMSNVIIMISSSSVTLPNPTKPALMKIGQSHGPKSKSKSISKPWSDLDNGSTSQTSGTTTSSRSGVKSSVSQVDPR